MGDIVVNKVRNFLKKSSKGGFTITELVGVSNLSRSAIRTALAKLEGANKVVVRQVGMAKLYCIKNAN